MSVSLIKLYCEQNPPVSPVAAAPLVLADVSCPLKGYELILGMQPPFFPCRAS